MWNIGSPENILKFWPKSLLELLILEKMLISKVLFLPEAALLPN